MGNSHSSKFTQPTISVRPSNRLVEKKKDKYTDKELNRLVRKYKKDCYFDRQKSVDNS